MPMNSWMGCPAVSAWDGLNMMSRSKELVIKDQ